MSKQKGEAMSKRTFRDFLEGLENGDEIIFVTAHDVGFSLALTIHAANWDYHYCWNEARFEMLRHDPEKVIARVLTFAEEFISDLIGWRELKLSAPQFCGMTRGNKRKKISREPYALEELNQHRGDGTTARYYRERERLHHIRYTVIKLEPKPGE